MVLLRSPAGQPSSRAAAVSDTGWVVGEVTAADGTDSLVRWGADGTPVVVAAGQDARDAQVNDRGDVAAGRILWRDGVTTEVAPAFWSRVADLTEDGRVLVSPMASEPRYPYVWDDGARTDVVPPPPPLGIEMDNIAIAMNEDGRVLGTRAFDFAGGGSWWWQDGVAADIANPRPGQPAFDLSAEALNEAGQVAGTLSPDGAGFLWDDGTTVEIAPLVPGGYLDVTGLSDAGHVIGSGWAGPAVAHAFVWHDGETTDLGTLPGDTQSRAVDVNARGEVVGISYDDAGAVRGFLWRGGEMQDLGGFGAGDTRPAAISEDGEVVGTSVDANGVARAVRWRPAG
jgi:probable HAF family extracellular repeat protein